MGLTRNDGLTAIQTALVALTYADAPAFQAVYIGPRRSLSGASPVAFVFGASLQLVREARRLYSVPAGFSVDILVQAPAGFEEAAEQRLSILVESSIRALEALGLSVGESSLAGGAPLLNFDSVYYRVERIPVRTDASNDYRG